MNGVNAAAAHRIELHRRVAVIRPGRIEVRPSRRALRGPLIAFLCGAGSFAALLFGQGVLPLTVLALLLIVAVIAIPLAGIGVIYALIGAHVVIDASKGSATWQQGMIGLGIGTQELVPFTKITAIVVEEAGATAASGGRLVEELAQWQIVMEKTSGRRLVIGGVTAPRSLTAEARARAVAVASAIADLTGAPLRVPSNEPERREGRLPRQRTVRRRRHGARRT